MNIIGKVFLLIYPFLMFVIKFSEAIWENHKAYPLFFKIWYITGFMPGKIESTETKKGIKYTVSFSGKLCSYWCIPDPSGNFYHIGNIDFSGMFDQNIYLKRSYLISTLLNKPEKAKFYEAVFYCAYATNVLEKFHLATFPTKFDFKNKNTTISFM